MGAVARGAPENKARRAPVGADGDRATETASASQAEVEPGSESRWDLRTLGARAGAVLSLATLLVAAWFLHRELASVDFAEVSARIQAHSLWHVAAAIALTALGYTVLTGYDALALRYVGRIVPYAQTALTSFTAYAVAHNVGVGLVSGGSIRYRRYSSAGLSATEIARVVAFVTVTFGVGSTILFGSTAVLVPATELSALGVPVVWARAGGWLMLSVATAYIALPLVRQAPVALGRWQIDVPSFGTTLAQALLSIADLACASAVLYVLLMPGADVGYLPFLGIYMTAIAAGLLSNLPGGIGVFEAVLFLALPGVDRETLLGAIIVYRLIYYVAPLMAALIALAADEAHRYDTRLHHAKGALAAGIRRAVTLAASGFVFLAGVVLLASGSTPSVLDRITWIHRILPLPLLELSHLAGSVLGLALLILARGLASRLRVAYQVTVWALLAGAAASLLKGFDYEEAVVLLATAALLRASRRQFHRQGRLLDQRFSLPWVIVIGTALIGALWLGIASYRHVPFSNELWWQFSLDGDAPRSLRAATIVVVAAIAFSVHKLLRPAAPLAFENIATRGENVRAIVAEAIDPGANAVWIGDKRLLFNEAGTAFIMYQISGRSWIALGDPVGPPATHEDLLWRYRELCDHHAGRAVFYQVTNAHLPHYIDMGMTFAKLGEDGFVDLAEFSLDGRARGDLRWARNRAAREGATFEVIRREGLSALMPQLAEVSTQWLRSKATAEKGFSLGRFSPDYLGHFDCAVVRRAGAVVAFANLWPAPGSKTVSVDLMRYGVDAPKSVMDFLLIELMLWAKANGFERFGLGMAPLSGLESHPLASVWNKVGNLIFRNSESFYNFAGLRNYKEKFAPTWQPRYLACPTGLVVPRALFDVAVLISGGVAPLALPRR